MSLPIPRITTELVQAAAAVFPQEHAFRALTTLLSRITDDHDMGTILYTNSDTNTVTLEIIGDRITSLPAFHAKMCTIKTVTHLFQQHWDPSISLALDISAHTTRSTPSSPIHIRHLQSMAAGLPRNQVTIRIPHLYIPSPRNYHSPPSSEYLHQQQSLYNEYLLLCRDIACLVTVDSLVDTAYNNPVT